MRASPHLHCATFWYRPRSESAAQSSQLRSDKDWGFVGSLGEAATKLELAIMHLGGNPVKIMDGTNALLYPVKPKGFDSKYVTIPKDA